MPFVYFIHEEGHTEVFKIGKTEKHPADRCEQLQTGNPRKLVIYRWLEVADHTAIEGYLHGKYRDVRVRGEWFYITKDQIDIECAIIMGAHAECASAGLAFLGKNVAKGMSGGGIQQGVPGRPSEDFVKVSDEYPPWTDEDRIQVQEERQKRGRYRGKRNPRDVANARNDYFQGLWMRADAQASAPPNAEKIFTDE